jgi:hypothetical protein
VSAEGGFEMLLLLLLHSFPCYAGSFSLTMDGSCC